MSLSFVGDLVLLPSMSLIGEENGEPRDVPNVRENQDKTNVRPLAFCCRVTVLQHISFFLFFFSCLFFPFFFEVCSLSGVDLF